MAQSSKKEPTRNCWRRMASTPICTTASLQAESSLRRQCKRQNGRASACLSFAVFAHGAFPAEMHHAQTLQKIFSVAAGDHSLPGNCFASLEKSARRAI